MKAQTILAFLAVVFVVCAASGQRYEFAKLLADDGIDGDQFGNSVAIKGDMIVVGAKYESSQAFYSGAAYLFDAATGEQIAKLLPDEGFVDQQFGSGVAVGDSWVIVGAPMAQIGFSRGAAFLFDKTTGALIRRIYPEHDAGGNFGGSVAADGDTAIIGAIGKDAAYVYRDGRYLRLTIGPADGFGYSVDIDNNIAIVGDPWNDDNGSHAGTAYLFDATTGEELFELVPLDGDPGDEFGESVAIEGQYAIVGSHRAQDNGEDSGAVYIFDTFTGLQIAKIVPADGREYEYFGIAVSLSGTRLVVGARVDDDNGVASGSAYLFDIEQGKQVAKLLASDGSEWDELGRSAAIDGDTAIVGAIWGQQPNNGDWTGAVYLFNATPCGPDLTGDGRADTRDVLAFLKLWAAGDGEADWDKDGDVDEEDFSRYLAEWIKGC